MATAAHTDERLAFQRHERAQVDESRDSLRGGTRYHHAAVGMTAKDHRSRDALNYGLERSRVRRQIRAGARTRANAREVHRSNGQPTLLEQRRNPLPAPAPVPCAVD